MNQHTFLDEASVSSHTHHLGSDVGNRAIDESLSAFTVYVKDAMDACVQEGREFNIDRAAFQYRLAFADSRNRREPIQSLVRKNTGNGATKTFGGSHYFQDEGFGEVGDFGGLNILLTQQFVKIREQRIPRTNLINPSFIPHDKSVAFGRKFYLTARMAGRAEAHIMGTRPSTAGKPRMEFSTFSTPIRYLSSYIESDLIDSAEKAILQVDDFSAKMKLGKEALDRLENRLLLTGNEDFKIYGLLNHPFLARVYSNLSFDSTVSDNRDLLAEVKRLLIANTTAEPSIRGEPTRLTLALKIQDYLANTDFANVNRTDSILKRIVDDLGVRRNGDGDSAAVMINGIPEFNDFDTNTHLALFTGKDGIYNVRPGADILLPVERRSTAISTAVIRATGGLKTENPIDNYVGIMTSTYNPGG